MSSGRPVLSGDLPDTNPVYVISVAAQLAGMHPQTLRTYDRLGLVVPVRTAGRGRRYSARDITLLREVQRLSQEEGVNLEGIRRILELERLVATLREQARELATELSAPVRRPSAGSPRHTPAIGGASSCPSRRPMSSSGRPAAGTPFG